MNTVLLIAKLLKGKETICKKCGRSFVNKKDHCYLWQEEGISKILIRYDNGRGYMFAKYENMIYRGFCNEAEEIARSKAKDSSSSETGKSNTKRKRV